jgi:hypothetical protein
MTYLILRELQLPFGEWIEQIRAVRNQYAEGHKIAARTVTFDWKDLKPVSGSEVGAISLE